MSAIRVGSAPDSWGVWFPDDPQQTPYTRFLDEVSASGYEWIELGPFGYLPTDPAKLTDELGARGLKLSAGTVFEHLHQDDSWDAVWNQIKDVAKLTAAVGGKHVVVIPEMWRDPSTGVVLEDRNLTPEQWRKKTDGMNALGKAMLEEYGVMAQYHPHADSHVDIEDNVYKFLEGTDERFVNLCLDTGHISYCGGDNLAIINKHPERIGYLHLKQVDPAIVAKVEAEDLPFGEAVKLGAMIEPPRGIPDMPPLLEAIEKLGIDVFAIVEQDMYPCHPDTPLPIAAAHSEIPVHLWRPRRPFQLSNTIEEYHRMSDNQDLRIAVLGVGIMGADHVDRITNKIGGARVTVVNDYSLARAEEIAALTPGSRVVVDPFDAIAAEDVDAVVLATPGPTHEKQVLACLEAGKPVLCEKPLTTDADSSLAIVKAEAALGKKLIQVGFMRRFDHEYTQLKDLIDSGDLGRPLVVHCAHRNPAVPNGFDSAMIVKDSLVHEVDVTRFLLDEEITSVQIIRPSANSLAPEGIQDPQIAIFETESGRHVDAEVFVTTGVAYEVRTEVVGELGSAMIGLDVGLIRKTKPGNWGGQITQDSANASGRHTTPSSPGGSRQ